MKSNFKMFIAGVFTALTLVWLKAPAQVSLQDADARAREIVSQMTLDEKLTELHGIRDDTHYRYIPPIPRLGLPEFRITNGPAGVGPDGAGTQAPATALPSPISLAATWDVAAARGYGEIAGGESRMLGNGLLEAPTINIARIPQNGRTFEGYGEDPYLAARLSVNNIQGIQSKGEIANVKHFAANNQETDRFVVNEIIDERTLREIYLPAFEASIKEGHSASVMCAYPQVNGTFCCENDLLMNQILKKEWAYDGFITSDFGAVHSSAPSALAGLDLEMPTGKYFSDELKTAVQSGKVPEALLDDKLIRRFRTMMRFGLFDTSPARQVLPAQPNGATARRLAVEGMVLLKNDSDLLPLDAAHVKSLAVIGPYAAEAVTGGGGSSHVVPLYTVKPLDGIRNRAGANVRVDFADGKDVAQAVALARAADTVIIMAGQTDREGRDHELVLPDNQDALIDTIAGANPRIIVVLKTGSAVLMPWIAKVPAILEAWYPGEEDGNAVADVLFGDVNPSGRLPITFPRTVDDTFAKNPETYPGVNKEVHYAESVFVGYRYYDAKGVTPLFPFGHGLSYTTFEYKNLHISPATASATAGKFSPVNVEFDVTNAGKRAGTEIPQLYVGLPSSGDVPQPPAQLKGFSRQTLKPGQTVHVRLTLDGSAFSYWDVATHGWKVMPGAVQILVGSSSRLIRLRGSIQVK
jgi:beta-glucosidase